ncbi:MAG: 16S rRNA (uracil(1498)-N(3))-methyltransferase [Xanthomonadaceae bacterium]|nr:16S rRNA (uracil(1498)-N(3))-methyltransferase [Xanthomonadaceae bacterium]
MRGIRVFHAEPLTDDASFTLAPGAARHLVRVLRLRAGARFTVFDGSGREWPAELVDEKGDARTGVGAAVDRESPLPVTLVQGVSKGERMDIAVQKAVELGAVAIWPVIAERSVVQLDAQRAARRVAHWQGIAVAACEQCGRNLVPRVHEPMPFADWLAANELPTLVLEPGANATLADAAVQPGAGVALLVGPEGGFSESELAAARAAGCTAVRLGPRVLRTETAGIAMLAALQALYGDYR